MAAGRHTGSGTATPLSTTGSTTVTETEAGPSVPLDLTQATLRLRAEPEAEGRSSARRIQWAEDVVDNEGMGKKSSKVCCIYHKPRDAGESSSDESSSSSSSDESDSEPDLSRARSARARRGRPHGRHQHHNGPCHDEGSSAEGDINGASSSKGTGEARKPSPNAYEKVPKRKEQKT